MTTYWRITYADGTRVTIPARQPVTQTDIEHIAETVQGEGYGAIESIEQLDQEDIMGD